jgi:ATP diphosphatase
MSSPTPERPLQRLLAVMQRLRAPDGCPWDREQTFATLAPFAIEEAYEVADAAERHDMEHLKDELGDLLFQVIFHAQLAAEAGHFDFDAVTTAILDKLVRRHPYVFGAESAAGLKQPRSAAAQSVVWEDTKAAERAADAQANAAPSALNGVPLALPALLRAGKLSRRAARVGFDFEHARETADKVAEELAEVRQATASAHVFEEVGDLLFAAANLARKLDVDAEAALRAANIKFERRFRGMEQLAAQRGENLANLGLAAQEALWQEVKRAE